jgi:hypothetical protein
MRLLSLYLWVYPSIKTSGVPERVLRGDDRLELKSFGRQDSGIGRGSERVVERDGKSTQRE